MRWSSPGELKGKMHIKQVPLWGNIFRGHTGWACSGYWLYWLENRLEMFDL